MVRYIAGRRWATTRGRQRQIVVAADTKPTGASIDTSAARHLVGHSRLREQPRPPREYDVLDAVVRGPSRTARREEEWIPRIGSRSDRARAPRQQPPSIDFRSTAYG